ncbi:hypothetical protein SAE01_11570 [Segetibacter aerophilus]|uniref:Uncharacterized protein n=1 Tax=Segetibacter aerophilus TaxID=670293 RepID=A0A512B9M8_9BACT|nr:hypothetical protein SAE01_11570 [Segetibacter aerophilus]
MTAEECYLLNRPENSNKKFLLSEKHSEKGQNLQDEDFERIRIRPRKYLK